MSCTCLPAITGSSFSPPYAFVRDVLDELVIGAGVGIQSVKAPGTPQLFEESLEDPVHEGAALKRINGPVVLGSVGRIDAQNAAQEELERTGGPRFDSRRRDAPHRLQYALHVAGADHELGI